MLDDTDNRVLSDARIRNIYSVFRAGMERAGAKHHIGVGEFRDVGIQMTFAAAGASEDIDHLMWEMNTLLRQEDVLADRAHFAGLSPTVRGYGAENAAV